MKYVHVPSTALSPYVVVAMKEMEFNAIVSCFVFLK